VALWLYAIPILHCLVWCESSCGWIESVVLGSCLGIAFGTSQERDTRMVVVASIEIMESPFELLVYMSEREGTKEREKDGSIVRD